MLNQDWLRYSMRLSMEGPKVTVRWADHHARMAEHWGEHARNLGRPPYHEAPGFTRDRWQLQGSKGPQTSVCGREVSYGYMSRSLWKYIWLAMREAFLSAIAEGEYSYHADRNRYAVIAGVV